MHPHLSGQRTRETDNPALGRNVMGQVLQSGKESYRGDIYDGPRALLDHMGHDESCAMKDTLKVDVLHGVPLLFCHFEERLTRINAGIVDQNVDAAKAFERILNNFLHGITAASIGFKTKRRARFPMQSRCVLLDPRSVQVGEKYVGSLLGKQLRYSGANPCGCSGHNDNLILDQFHPPLLSTRGDVIKCAAILLALPRGRSATSRASASCSRSGSRPQSSVGSNRQQHPTKFHGHSESRSAPGKRDSALPHSISARWPSCACSQDSVSGLSPVWRRRSSCLATCLYRRRSSHEPPSPCAVRPVALLCLLPPQLRQRWLR